jgi:hypothetical protein
LFVCDFFCFVHRGKGANDALVIVFVDLNDENVRHRVSYGARGYNNAIEADLSIALLNALAVYDRDRNEKNEENEGSRKRDTGMLCVDERRVHGPGNEENIGDTARNDGQVQFQVVIEMPEKCPTCDGDKDGLFVCSKCWDAFLLVMYKIKKSRYLQERAKGYLKDILK